MNALSACAIGLVVAMSVTACTRATEPVRAEAAADPSASSGGAQDANAAVSDQQTKKPAVVASPDQANAPTVARRTRLTDPAAQPQYEAGPRTPAAALAVTAPRRAQDACGLVATPQRVTTLAASPAFQSPRQTPMPLATLRGGTDVQVLSRSGDWLLVQIGRSDLATPDQVLAAPRQGFLHCASVTS